MFIEISYHGNIFFVPKQYDFDVIIELMYFSHVCNTCAFDLYKPCELQMFC